MYRVRTKSQSQAIGRKRENLIKCTGDVYTSGSPRIGHHEFLGGLTGRENSGIVSTIFSLFSFRLFARIDFIFQFDQSGDCSIELLSIVLHLSKDKLLFDFRIVIVFFLSIFQEYLDYIYLLLYSPLFFRFLFSYSRKSSVVASTRNI